MKKYDNIMLKTALLWSKMSYCKRLQVGAVLAKEGRILATGYNGTISQTKNICEEVEVYNNTKKYTDNDIIKTCTDCQGIGLVHIQQLHYLFTESCETCNGTGKVVELDKTSDFTLHAEQNIITFCAKEGISTKDATLYITHSPCKNCAKLIAQAGITEVVYLQKYKDIDSINFLQKCKVKIKQYNLKDNDESST